MTQEELNRYEEGCELQSKIETLRNVIFYAETGELPYRQSDNSIRELLWISLSMVQDKLIPLFKDKLDELEQKLHDL